MPPSPICWRSLYGPTRSPGRSPGQPGAAASRRRGRLEDAGGPVVGVEQLAPTARAPQQGLDPRRSPASPAQAARDRRRSAGAAFSRAATKIVSSLMADPRGSTSMLAHDASAPSSPRTVRGYTERRGLRAAASGYSGSGVASQTRIRRSIEAPIRRRPSDTNRTLSTLPCRRPASGSPAPC